MLDPKFVLVGAVLNLIGSIGYVIDTLKGKTKPNRVTWFLWALAPMMAFAAQLQEGVGLRALMTFMVGFGPMLVLIASFVNKKSVWDLSRFDYFCGGLSLLGLVLWLVTKEGNLAIVFGIAADALAGVPTVVKAYKEPESENGRLFLLGAASATITLLTIDTWEFSYYAFPVYILLICLLIWSLVEFKLGKKLSFGEADTTKPI